MILYTEVVYTKKQPSTAKPLNDAYRRKRGTHKPFNPSPEQVLANERAAKRERAKLKKQAGNGSPWRYNFKLREDNYD